MVKALLTSYVFVNFIVPLLIGGLTVFVKYASKNDQHASFKKEDIAIGFDIALGSVIAFTVNAVAIYQKMYGRAPDQPDVSPELASQALLVPWAVVALVFSLWLVSTGTRKYGWKNKDEMNWGMGVIVPLVYGIITLIFATAWISGTHLNDK